MIEFFVLMYKSQNYTIFLLDFSIDVFPLTGWVTNEFIFEISLFNDLM